MAGVEGEVARFALDQLKSKLDDYRQEQKEQSQLINGASTHVKQLEEDMSALTKFLKESIERSRNEILNMRKLLRDVRSSIYDAEDTIDALLIHAAGKASKKSKLSKIAKDVKSCCVDVKKVRDLVDDQNRSDLIKGGRLLVEYGETPGEPDAVGFSNEIQALKDGFSQHTSKVDVIIVTGAGGVGKTTLAAKIFHDSEIRETFNILPLWVHVSDCTTKNIFLTILSLLDELPKEASEKTASALSAIVARCLKTRTVFIVIDGVSQIQDPSTLLSAFKGTHMNSKLLITTASTEVVRLVGLHSHSTEVPVQPLKDEESLELLKRLVFPTKHELPPDFIKDGKEIAESCRGLPLAIFKVADILAKKMSQYLDFEVRVKIWGSVSGSMDTFFTKMPGNPMVVSIYDTLDYHLRACFLYMGIFQERYKFSVSELIRMWIAEGFIPPPDAHNPSMERTAQKYLEQLIERNLVIVHQKKPDGTSPKICSLNNLLYDFCKTVAGYENENFLQEVMESATNPGDFRPSMDQLWEYRRICMHANISKFIEKLADFQNSKVRFVFHLRSFVSHYSEMCTVKKNNFSTICSALKLIRVLDAKPMGFTKIPNDLYELVHLRYVTLSLSGDVLPSDICKLRKVQTLVVHTTSPSLKIEADVSKMTELLLLKTNKPATLAKASESYNENLHMYGLSPKSCTESFFKRASSLKKLGIRGQLALLLDGTTGLLPKLLSVEKLKLLNDVTAVSSSKANKPCCLSQHSQFPPNLRSLTLSATRLPWSQIAALGSVINLEELKLKDNAFVGEKWEVSDNNFSHLKLLHIQGADFREWKSSTNSFLQLVTLQLSSCMNLMEIPSEFSGISNHLNQLYLSKCPQPAADSARRIRVEIKQRRGIDLDLHIEE